MEALRDSPLERGWLQPPAGGEGAAHWRALRALASPRLTLALLAWLGVGVVLTYRAGGAATWPLVAPLAASCVNLLAAIAFHPVFRRHGALLVFHLALVAIIVLVALGRLTYLKGHVELASGEGFTGRLTGHEAGPWHPWGIAGVRFRNEGFTIDYLPGRRRDRTQNRVSHAADEGGRRTLLIGDQVPLVLAGYRFYTSHNKGFALGFAWTPSGGATQRGRVHLPGYPVHEYRQANTWTPPGARGEVWVQLQFDEPLLAPEGAARFRTPGSHQVVVRVGDLRRELQPGDAVRIDGGTLVYEGIGTWMGYRVFYDWTLPWLLAASVVAVVSLGWHFGAKYAARPWQTRAGAQVPS